MTIGADLHQRTHTAVAVDDNGRKLAERTVAATPAGHLARLRWARERFAERTWALEDCRHLSRGLERDLLVAGETVLRVPPKLMAGTRRGGREPGKSDLIAALATARAALREPDLPVARLDGAERDLRLLVDHREDLVAERTRIEQRLRCHLHELMPGEEPPARGLDRTQVLLTQLLPPGPGRGYLEKRPAAGNTKSEAIRALRRPISDEVFRRMRHDEASTATDRQGHLAAAA